MDHHFVPTANLLQDNSVIEDQLNDIKLYLRPLRHLYYLEEPI